ncbi:MAG: hypothetical protein MJ059_05565 [Lachnospiraceae bacterium]|nr:hypothetical protein [Lachnospiraceae bacterium]
MKKILFIVSLLTAVLLQAFTSLAFPDPDRAWQQKDGQGRKEIHVGDVLDSNLLGVGAPDESGYADLAYTFLVNGKPVKPKVTSVERIPIMKLSYETEDDYINGTVAIKAEITVAPGSELTVSACYNTIFTDHEYDWIGSGYSAEIRLPTDKNIVQMYNEGRHTEAQGITNKGAVSLQYRIPADIDHVGVHLSDYWTTLIRREDKKDSWRNYTHGVYLIVMVYTEEKFVEVEETAGSEKGEFSGDEISGDIIGNDNGGGNHGSSGNSGSGSSGGKDNVTVTKPGGNKAKKNPLAPVGVVGGLVGLGGSMFLGGGDPGPLGGSPDGGGKAGGKGKKSKTEEKPKKKKEEDEKKDDDEDKQSTYRIVLYKNFGEILRAGEKEKIIGARIEEETPEGKVWDRPELTERITISGSDNLQIVSKGVIAPYMSAGITVSPSAIPQSREAGDQLLPKSDPKGVIIFSYSGEGGTYTSRVSFKIEALEPEIVFENGNEWVEERSISLLADPSYEEKLLILMYNTEDEPEKILLENDSDFNVVVEKTSYERIYQLKFSSYSGPALKDEKGFGERKESSLEIRAYYSDSLIVTKRLDMKIYPEGICIQEKPNKDGFIEVISYANRYRNADSLDPVVQPTVLHISSAVKNPDGSIRVNEKGALIFGDMEAETEKNKNLVEKYDYKIETRWESDGEVTFAPNDSIPELSKPVEVWIPVSLSNKMGAEDSVRIPLLLLGDPEGSMAEWKEEYHNLLDRINRYFPPEMALEHLENVKLNYSDPTRVSAAQLRFMSHRIIKLSQTYWEQVRDEILIQDTMDEFWQDQMELAKAWGDVAFSIVVTYYAGSAAEIWLTPAKDIMAPLVGELVYVSYTGEDFNWKNLSIAQNLESGLSNYIMNFIDAKNTINPQQLRQAAGIMAGFLIYKACVHFYETEPEKRDWLDAFESAFSDLTKEALKKIVSIQLPNVLKGNTALQKNIAKQMRKVLGPKFTKTIQEGFEKSYKSIAEKGFKGVARMDGSHAKWAVTPEYVGNVEDLSETFFNKVGYKEITSKIIETMVGNEVDGLVDNKSAIQGFLDTEIMTIKIDTASIAAGYGLTEAQINAMPDDFRYIDYTLTLGGIFSGQHSQKLFELVYDMFFGMLATTDAPVTMDRDPVPMLKKMGE